MAISIDAFLDSKLRAIEFGLLGNAGSASIGYSGLFFLDIHLLLFLVMLIVLLGLWFLVPGHSVDKVGDFLEHEFLTVFGVCVESALSGVGVVRGVGRWVEKFFFESVDWGLSYGVGLAGVVAMGLRLGLGLYEIVILM